MRICPKCGEENANNLMYCLNCGADLKKPSSYSTKRFGGNYDFLEDTLSPFFVKVGQKLIQFAKDHPLIAIPLILGGIYGGLSYGPRGACIGAIIGPVAIFIFIVIMQFALDNNDEDKLKKPNIKEIEPYLREIGQNISRGIDVEAFSSDEVYRVSTNKSDPVKRIVEKLMRGDYPSQDELKIFESDQYLLEELIQALYELEAMY